MYVQDLTGAWTLNRVDRKKDGLQIADLAATVPGCVYTDLLDAELIDDPYYRDNELKTQWIGLADWSYSRSFELDEEFTQLSRQLLRCTSLDTLATVKLNGKVIGESDNQYRLWEFDVAGITKAGENTLEIIFKSPKPLIDELKMEREAFQRGGNSVPWSWAGRSTIRKSPCSFGWDWGPSLPTCGILGAISMVGFDSARLDDVFVKQNHTRGGKVKLDISLAAEKVGRSKLTAAVTLSFGGKVVAETQVAFKGKKALAEIAVDKARLWWPAGHGDQPLYELNIDLLDDDGGLLDTSSKRIGLRTIKLVRKPDKWGESFYFEVNGRPIFAKGGNWIPADTFVTRIGDDDYRRLLQDCVDANMNMIRVWGGGIYEPAIFYDICDELGLMVWQDFMYACATYPTYKQSFMDNVAIETAEQIARLRHHASIALWCGNNELEQCVLGEECEDVWEAHKMSWTDYKALFDKLIPSLIKKLDPQRDYWPSSAHSPRGNRRDFNNPTCGDAHLWDVWHGRKPFEWYRTCEHRFNSEFGFQSFPEPRTVYDYTIEADRNITSPVMEHHQRSGAGNALIMHYMLDWFRLPKDFESLLWLSQILQGMSMKYACEHWRRSMPRGMGTLYWQINDCWPVASWASIDFHGRWKALQYMARKFFAPVLVSVLEADDASSAELHVTSDLPEKSTAKCTWVVTDLEGNVLETASKQVKIPAGGNTVAHKLKLAKLVAAHGRDNLLIWATLSDRRGNVISDNLGLLDRPKRLELPKAKVTTTSKKIGDSSFELTLKSDRPSLWTIVELGDIDAKYSDNFMHLRPGCETVITVTTAEDISASEFNQRLNTRSLVDTY